jgi:hypothetical protein
MHVGEALVQDVIVPRTTYAKPAAMDHKDSGEALRRRLVMVFREEYAMAASQLRQRHTAELRGIGAHQLGVNVPDGQLGTAFVCLDEVWLQVWRVQDLIQTPRPCYTGH